MINACYCGRQARMIMSTCLMAPLIKILEYIFWYQLGYHFHRRVKIIYMMYFTHSEGLSLPKYWCSVTMFILLRVTCWKMLITVALTKCVYFKIHHGGRCCVSKICGIAFEWELSADCTLIAKNIVTYIKMFCRFSLWRQKWERGRDSGGSVTGWQLHTTSLCPYNVLKRMRRISVQIQYVCNNML